MSDSYITLVPNSVDEDESCHLADIVIKDLIDKQVIKSVKTHCTLGEEGFAPGKNYMSVTEEHSYCIWNKAVNGLEVITSRTVFENGGNGLDAIICPVCSHNVIDTDWNVAIDTWFNRTDNGKHVCSFCKSVNSIINFTFVPTWGFGSFGLRFWNWPPFKNSFINNIERLTNKRIIIVYGRI
jgi:hypothetical protein